MMQSFFARLALLVALPVLATAQTPGMAPAVQLTQAPTTTTDAATVAAPTAPRTTIPSDSNARARPTWTQACRDRVAAMKGRPVDILFVGDSITEGWTSKAWGGEKRGLAVWDKMYAGRNALNFGVGADKTQNVLWRLDTLDVHDLKPQVAVLLIGTNNPEDTAEDIAAGVHAILDKLQVMYPGVKTILVSIMPNRRANERMMDADTRLQAFADNKAVFYLDLVPLMPSDGDNWKGLGPDHLHPTEVGYQIWADAMEPLLARLLSRVAP